MLRRAFTVAVLSFVVSSGVTAVPPPVSVIDQENLPAAVATATHALGGPTEQVLSQTVTAGVAGRLIEVRLPFGCEGGRVVLEIRDVDPSTGQPGSTVYRRRTFPGAHFPTPVTDEFQTLAVGGPVDFALGDTFAIVLTNEGGSCGVWPAPAGDTYPGGTGWLDPNDGPIVPMGLGGHGDDAPFQTVMRVR